MNAHDIDQLCSAIASNQLEFDLDGNQQVDLDDVLFMAQQFAETEIGDVNSDGRFDSSDLVHVFQAGQYEDGELKNSNWQSGDWNCDSEFDSSDLVFAFLNR